MDQILIATSPPPVERYVSADFAETTPQATNDVGCLSFIHSEVTSTPSLSVDPNFHFGNGFHTAWLDGLPWFQFQSLLNIPGKAFFFRIADKLQLNQMAYLWQIRVKTEHCN